MDTVADDTVRRPAPGTWVLVEVPATSANLGPGFDAFGLALDLRDVVALEVISAGFVAEATGEGASTIPHDERHLIVSSALAGLADLGVEVPGLKVRSLNTIPHGRGLGSSSAAIVAGLAGAAALCGAPLDRDWLLGLANRIEGHPDNVAAAIWGGFILAYAEAGQVKVSTIRLAPEIATVAWIPPTPVSTAVARDLLPETVPHADAAANAAGAGLLVHAMSMAPELLLSATRDWLHQSYRSSAMPASYELMERLRADGYAAVISGAGPTVIVLTHHGEVSTLLARQEPGFAARRLLVGGGVRILSRSVDERG